MKQKSISLFILLSLFTFFEGCSLESKEKEEEEVKEREIVHESEYYSFGLISALNTKELLLEKNYIKAEELIKSLNSDDLTQTLDYIGLSLNENVLLNWLKESKDKNIPNLFLGVHHNHQAWRARTHTWAKDVPKESILNFIEYQEQSKQFLLSINDNSHFKEEANSRLIRHYMGENDLEKAREYFEKTIALNNENLWAYIHYSEVIQPKWNGNLKLIKDLLNDLPQRQLIKQIVTLKIVLDSYIINENYFGGTMEELDKRATKILTEIDTQVSKSPSKSIHRYIVYNYLYSLAEELENNTLQIKNYQKMNDFLTLYPYGIVL